VSKLNKWNTGPAQSPNPMIRFAYFAGVFAAQRDTAMIFARSKTDRTERQQWVARARFEHLQMLAYIRRLRNEMSI